MNKQLIGYILLGIFGLLALLGGIILVIIKNTQKSNGNCDSSLCKFPHGKCEQNKCVCNAGWSGEDCLTPSNNCDSTKCKSPNGTCNKNGICECGPGYAGENCLTKCEDGENSILCSNNLTYKCCDKSIKSCDLNNNCCETGLNKDKTLCEAPWTCSDASYDDLGKCSSGDCPDNWCPDMKFIFCDEGKIVKNKMYLFKNVGTDTYRTYKTNCSGDGDNCVDQEWAFTRATCLGPTSDNKHEPDSIDFSEKRMQPGYEKLNPDSYIYIDDNRPNKTLDECSNFSKICHPKIKESDNYKFFDPVWADPSYIWSLQKYKYVQFEPNKPNSLLFQICNMYTKSFSCDMFKNNMPSNKPAVCIGMGPREMKFPDTTKLGTFFSFSKEKQFFPSLPNNSEYGSWSTGVPWVEFEQPICGEMVDGKTSNIRNTKFPTGCTTGPTPDDKTIWNCGPVAKHTPYGSYMFVRVQDPSTKKYYRFYIGCPPNIGDTSNCDSSSLQDENHDPIGSCFAPSCDNGCSDAGKCMNGKCWQTTLFFFTEDVAYGLEKYLSAISCQNSSKETTAGMPYCWNNAGGESKQVDLFLWDNLEINPLPPNTSDAWQDNSINFTPDCSKSTCDLSSTYWVSPVNNQNEHGLYCHNINAEKAPNINWDKINPENENKMSTLTDVTQPTPGVYYSKCINGSQVSDSDICNLYSLSTQQMKNIDGSCNISGQDFCESGIKAYSYNQCKNASVTDLYYSDGNNCTKNTDTTKNKKDLYPDKYCSSDYACSNFIN